jgi:hypothetical protein
MQKHILFTILLSLFTVNLHPKSPDINDYIQDHQKALQDLEPHISSISIESRIDKSYQHLPFAFCLFKMYQYLAPQHIRPLLLQYQLSKEELQNITRIESAQRGLIAGACMACCLRALKEYPSRKMEYLLCALIGAGIIAHQNYTMGTVPYYDWDLKKQDDLFTHNDWHALSRFFIAFNFAILSLDISQWAIYYAGL